ncbi:MAG: glycosyltransferase [Variibacter sp.]|nr:glycosyltransferase [Variibacter sp.]
MKIVLFCHSFVSCWNHGNVHFLRGIARELIRLGHAVAVYEAKDGWSRTELVREQGFAALAQGARVVPGVELVTYRPASLDLDRALDGADIVLVHEWTEPDLVRRIGRVRARSGRFVLLFHDTHHRAVSAPDDIAACDLEDYDGVLAFGEVLRQIYLALGWGRRAFTWHEAADTALFRPRAAEKDVDLVWIGNWGDGERDRELQHFLIEPVSRLGIGACVHGVRYPQSLRDRLAGHGIVHAGWVPNHRVPAAFARARVTVHIPRRPYATALPGIPTIRMFEALACGIPLVSAPWSDTEGLFPPGSYLAAAHADAMTDGVARLLRDRAFAAEQARRGLQAIRARHGCAHRVIELLRIVAALRRPPAPQPPTVQPLQDMAI